MIISNGNSRMHGMRGRVVSVAQFKIAALNEQRVESAWLQATENIHLVHVSWQIFGVGMEEM
jgi:hypothetical protein